MPFRSKAALKAKKDPAQYWQGGPKEMTGACRLINTNNNTNRNAPIFLFVC